MRRTITAALAAFVGLGATAAALCGSASAEQAPKRLAPVSAAAPEPKAGLRKADFSGGCFWGVQGVFSHVRGVTRAVSGYAGGQAATAHYEAVSTGLTGHAETVEVTYDPRQVSYAQLLQVFFSVALDPTQVNRQGPDEGSQYRSMIWARDASQRQTADAYIRQLDAAHAFSRHIATRVANLSAFYPAEAYHQNFMARRPDYPYIEAWDAPKVAALKTLFPADYSAKPVMG
ncbi:MAG TPA: peptide-methionine (S)-S-oxide reductase MsrA [Caulobacteraceae bacterium]|jgi:peptide-methionine (S)-S-oxide reductase|nr:peptide-methionine (S)-S-oxide reductase MsrA [Caulobacteraceae bacterium]